MTDAVTTALGDLDNAISSISEEMSTLVTQIGVLNQQINNGNPSPDLAAEIEQRATTIKEAVTAAQNAVPTPPPAPTPTPAPQADQPAAQASPAVSTPVEASEPAKVDPATADPASAGGSPMG
jgi:hypothetical protein